MDKFNLHRKIRIKEKIKDLQRQITMNENTDKFYASRGRMAQEIAKLNNLRWALEQIE